MAVVILSSLAGCGLIFKSDTPVNENAQAVADEQTEEKATDENAGVEEKLADVTAYVEDILSNDISKFDKKVDINNENITFTHKDYEDSDIEIDLTFDGIKIKEGTQVEELINAGYEMRNSDRKVEAGYEVSTFYMTNKENTQFGVSVYNDTDVDKQAKDCAINGFYCDARGIDYVDYRGLKKASDLDDVIDELGLPKSVYIGKIVNNDPFITLSYSSPFDTETYTSISLQISLTYTNNGTDIYEIHFL